MTVDDQSEISFSVSQGTLSGNKFLLVLSTPLSSATELSFGDIRQVAVGGWGDSRAGGRANVGLCVTSS